MFCKKIVSSNILSFTFLKSHLYKTCLDTFYKIKHFNQSLFKYRISLQVKSKDLMHLEQKNETQQFVFMHNK